MKTTRLTGYVALFVRAGSPYMVRNQVYPTKAAAQEAAEEDGVKDFVINAANVLVTKQAICADYH